MSNTYRVEDLTEAQRLKNKLDAAFELYRRAQGLTEADVILPENVKADTREGAKLLRAGRAYAGWIHWMSSDDYQHTLQALQVI